MSSQDPFSAHKDAILMAANEIYRATRSDVEPDHELSRINIQPRPSGSEELTRQDFNTAIRTEAKVNAAARAAARMAILQDSIEEGGVSGLIARFEIAATRVFERPYVKGALKPGGIVEIIRVREQ